MEQFKKVVKAILQKLPIFIFCIVFIQLHNSMFGEENSIIGVVLLIGLFFFMRGNLGYQTSQASLSIIFIFVIIAFAPKLSLINPFLGLIVNAVSIWLILMLSCHDVTQGNHVAFLLGYIFCQGYEVSGHAYELRVISLLVGSVGIALIYFLVNRKKNYTRTLKDVIKEMDLHSTRTQWYIRLTTTLAVTMFVCDLLSYPRTMWISLTILSLTTPFGEEHQKRSWVRIPGAILGTAVFYILFEIVVPDPYFSIVVLFAGFLAMFIQNYFVRSIYNSFACMGTAVLLFSTKGAIWLRVWSNIVGTVVAVVSYMLFTAIFYSINRKSTTV